MAHMHTLSWDQTSTDPRLVSERGDTPRRPPNLEMGNTMLDLRFLARRKALTVIAVTTMALALGANAAALTVLKAFLLSSLAVPESERVVLIAPERDLPGRGTVIFS